MDFLSLEPVKDIPLKRFITYKDEKGLCYGFDLKSVVNSFDVSEAQSSENQLNYNPFTRTPMKQEFLKDVRKIIKYSNDNKLRCKIAKKGRDKYFKYFNSTIVADFIINKTIGTKKKFYWEEESPVTKD